MKNEANKGIIWLSILGYIFWAVGMRLYYIDISRGNSLIPSVISVIVFATFIFARNYRFRRNMNKAFPAKSRIIECLFCVLTFFIPRIPLPNGFNILALDIASIILILVMRFLIFGIPLVDKETNHDN